MNDNVNKIKNLADLLALDELKRFNVADLARRFAGVENKYRHDQVIRNIGGVVEKMAQRNPNANLTGEEIYNLYNRFVSLDPASKFKEAFSDLLPREEAAKASISMNRNRHDYNVAGSERDLSMAKHAAIEVDEFEGALEHSVEAFIPSIEKFDTNLLKNNIMHDPKMVEAGRKLVATQLQTLGLGDVRADLKYGVKSCLLYLASFPTAQGKVFVNVPLAIKDNQLEIPSLFADKTGKKVYAFSEEGVKQLLSDLDFAREQAHLNIANASRHNMITGHREIKANTGAIEVDEVEAYVKDIAPVKLSKINPELADIEGILLNAVLRKESRFNDKIISTGRNLISEELAKHGYKYNQVRFAGDNPQGMTFDATLQTRKGKLELTIPIEVANNVPLFPTKFAADDGQIRDLNCDEIEAVISTEDNVEPVRYSAALVGMDYNSLRKVIHKATFDRRHSIVKEALSLIQDQFGVDAHNAAIADYQTWLEQAADDFSHRCTGCQYYRARGSRHATSSHDHCNLLHTKCSNVVKKAGICSRATLSWDRLRDDHYKGTIMTSSIKLT